MEEAFATSLGKRARKKEGPGVCYQWQEGTCTYGDNCRFSHDGDKAAGAGDEDLGCSSRSSGDKSTKREKTEPEHNRGMW